MCTYHPKKNNQKNGQRFAGRRECATDDDSCQTAHKIMFKMKRLCHFSAVLFWLFIFVEIKIQFGTFFKFNISLIVNFNGRKSQMKFKALSSNLFFRAATTSNTSEINHHSFSIFFFWNNLYDKKNGDKMFILSLTDIVRHHKMNLFHILCFFFLHILFLPFCKPVPDLHILYISYEVNILFRQNKNVRIISF